MKYFFIICFSILPSASLQAKGQGFNAFSCKFVDGYQKLNIRPLDLAYDIGLEHIATIDTIQNRIDFFESIKKQLATFSPAQLDHNQRVDYELINYESRINLERLALEKQWATNRPEKISADGIYTVPNGKAWYKYLLKRWLSADVTPAEIYKFGLSEVDRVTKRIENIRKQTGLSEEDFYKHLNDSSFFSSDPKYIQNAFEHTKEIVTANLHNIFNVYTIPNLKIEKGSNQALAQTPGYYNNGTFYYNLFDKPYNKRQFDWLFIHEGVPGHHFQLSINNQLKASPVRQLFFYYGFVEGWGAYAEELGKDVGLYKTPYDELGKWEWDIVRSVRVPLDIGLNYYGWTDDKALAFWKKHVRNQDDIAMREIKRLRHWPAQAITYKYGALQIIKWKETLKKNEGDQFDIKAFHDRILQSGVLPLFLLKKNVFGDI